jgi:hypothetical protein
MQSLVLMALARASYLPLSLVELPAQAFVPLFPHTVRVEEAVACSGTFWRLFNLIPILSILTFFVCIIRQFLPGGPIDMLVPPDEVCDEDVRIHSAWHNCGAAQKYHDRLYRHGHLHLRPYGAQFLARLEPDLVLCARAALVSQHWVSRSNPGLLRQPEALRHAGGGAGGVSLRHCDAYDPLHSSMLDELNKQYVSTARLQGLPEWKSMVHNHGARIARRLLSNTALIVSRLTFYAAFDATTGRESAPRIGPCYLLSHQVNVKGIEV